MEVVGTREKQNPLIPAKAGIHAAPDRQRRRIGGRKNWIPAFAGMSGVNGLKSITAALALAACSAEPAPRVYDRDPSLPADLPFSSAVVVGKTIYLSGEIGRVEGGVALVEGGVGAETRQIFDNYKRTLARLGADLSDIVKCTVFLDDMSKFAEMNEAYAEFFPEEKPARSTFGVEGLAMGAALEIECLAVKK